MIPDVFDTTSCPIRMVCGICSTRELAMLEGETEDLVTFTFPTDRGTYCLPLCIMCDVYAWQPPLDPKHEEAEKIAAHCQHLGITPFEMFVITDFRVLNVPADDALYSSLLVSAVMRTGQGKYICRDCGISIQLGPDLASQSRRWVTHAERRWRYGSCRHRALNGVS